MLRTHSLQPEVITHSPDALIPATSSHHYHAMQYMCTCNFSATASISLTLALNRSEREFDESRIQSASMAASWLESLPQCGAVTLIYVRSETTLQRSEESLLQCLLAQSEWKCQIKVRRQRGRKVASLLRCAARNRERMKLSPHVNWRIVDTTEIGALH